MTFTQSVINFWNNIFPKDPLAQDSANAEIESKMQNAPTFEALKAQILTEVKTGFDTQINDLNGQMVSLKAQFNQATQDADNLKVQVSELVQEKEAVESKLQNSESERFALVAEKESLISEKEALQAKEKTLSQELATLKASNVIITGDETPKGNTLNQFTKTLSSRLRDLNKQDKAQK